MVIKQQSRNILQIRHAQSVMKGEYKGHVYIMGTFKDDDTP
jgi:hypothetical protein